MMFHIAANISLLFRNLTLLERFAAASAAGFDGIEMQFPYIESAGALARACRASGIPAVLINAPVLPQYPFGIAGRPAMRDCFRAQLPQIVEYADALKVQHVHVLSGIRDCSESAEHCRQVYVDNLMLAAEALVPYGVDVMVEPLNAFDVPNYMVNSLDEAMAVLGYCGQRARLQFDVYHVTRMGLDALAQAKRLLPVVGHVQIADVPGRNEPGSGSVPFGPLLEVLHEGCYAGWIGAEYVPAASTVPGLGWLAQWRQKNALLDSRPSPEHLHHGAPKHARERPL
jgi:hydroxypyruvate isomerase